MGLTTSRRQAPNGALLWILGELLMLLTQLQEENRALRQRLDVLTTERASLLQKNEQVRTRVEAMIGRLKAMEHGA